MNIIYALEKLPSSIFLAGPTPREGGTPSWRPEALEILERLGYDGTVYVPEQEDWAAHDHYDDQVDWEWSALNRASTITFWVPRDLESMPAFTTNVEFGLHVASVKCILGYPEGAPKMKYLARLAKRYNVQIYNSLEETLVASIAKSRT